MIKSMTGFGKAKAQCGDYLIALEIKSLNGKALDASIKLPVRYRELELEIRNIFSEKLTRGKIDCIATIEKTNAEVALGIDAQAFVSLYKSLYSLAMSVGADTTNLLTYVLNQPEVKGGEQTELDDKEKAAFLDLAHKAVEQLDQYRVCEGAILEKDFEKRINLIGELLKEVEKYETGRCERIKDRLIARLKEIESIKTDDNRLEQEMIYYIEKLDITEEKVRLRQHLDYFLQCLSKEECQGKKLGFIAQEMGREINTLGSKANDADIQVLVVKMKDELEKIKEQVANIL